MRRWKPPKKRKPARWKAAQADKLGQVRITIDWGFQNPMGNGWGLFNVVSPFVQYVS